MSGSRGARHIEGWVEKLDNDNRSVVMLEEITETMAESEKL